MSNITLALDDDLIKQGRKYARQNGTTLNALIRELLANTVRPQENAADIFLAHAEKYASVLNFEKGDIIYDREECYRERLDRYNV